MTLPIKPAIPEAVLRRGSRPYLGKISVGKIFAWEPDLPHARELCVVTRLAEPEEPLRVKHRTGTALLSRGTEPQVWSRQYPDGGEEYNNDISRFREAVVPTIF